LSAGCGARGAATIHRLDYLSEARVRPEARQVSIAAIVIGSVVAATHAALEKRRAVDIASRRRNKVQLTMDGFKGYLEAVESAFRGQIEYATLTKLFASDFTCGASRK
jgi:predicted acylesterase/phospholipase RssA